jgi:hypothetical protein
MPEKVEADEDDDESILGLAFPGASAEELLINAKTDQG